MQTNRIYYAGPLFCAEEIGGMRAIAKVRNAQGLVSIINKIYQKLRTDLVGFPDRRRKDQA
jgi:hypothetical protein